MYEAEGMLVLAVVAWVLYEIYGSAWSFWFTQWSMYIRIAGGILLLLWIYYQSPEQFANTADLAQQILLTRSSGPSGSGGWGSKEKRNVTQLTKKKVAASQQWKCGTCGTTLDETYEVDHRLALYKGGSNDISNLVALCPHCHRKKTVEERLA
jgi:predicted HNH restriction endonuclease